MIVSTLLTLVAPAVAKNEVSIETIEIAHHGIEVGLVVLTSDLDATTASIAAEVESDSGSEDVMLTESNAWLSGSGGFRSLPEKTASISLTVYDSGNAELASFSGTIDATGAISRMVRADYCGDGVPHTTNGSPIDVSDRCGRGGAGAPDVELLGYGSFLGDGTVFDVVAQLQGSDTYEVAYAEIAITDGKSTETAEVGWDAVGTVWEADLTVAHEGLLAVKATAYDTDGEKLGAQKVKLGLPFADTTTGVNTLATDDDPLTRVALKNRANLECENVLSARCSSVVVVSDGWTLADGLPVDAEVELTDGETLTIPANSYQVTAATPIVFAGSPEKEAFQVSIDGTVVKQTSTFGDRGLCANGTCLSLAEDGAGGWTLSATAYTSASSKLPTSVKVTLTTTLKAASTKEESYTLTYGSDVSVVFANEVELAANPLGVDLAGKVSLLGVANKKGKQDTLAKGKFYGTFGFSSGGSLGLAGADKDEVQPKGDILIGGEPIDFELTDTDKDGVIEAPPVVVLRVSGHGKGTRAATTASSGNPGLL